MKDQFFGKPFWLILTGQVVVFFLAIAVFETPFVLWLMILLGVLLFGMTLKRLEYGICVFFGELFAHSHGYILSTTIFGFSFSFRMLIFVAVMAAWGFLFLRKKISFSLKDQRFFPFLILGLGVLLGFVVGFSQNNPSLVFQDGNAYFYLLYLLPLLSVSWDSQKQRLLLQTLAASALWVSLLTLGLLFIFTHMPEWQLSQVYRFIRDTRTGELTRISGNVYRIFLQSQFSVSLMFFLSLSLLWTSSFGRKKKISGVFLPLVSLSVCISVLLISLSRSFWVGLMIGSLTCMMLFFFFYPWKWKTVLAKKGLSVVAILMGFFLLLLVALFPYPKQFTSSDAFANIFSSRADQDAAVTSRWKLLGPMWETIAEQPFIGHGFGKEIVFQTDDPRAREQDASGLRRTHAFEWGWLELLVKMGMVSWMGFAALFVSNIFGLKGYLKTEKSWVGFAFISALVMLYVTQTFSPYLNHPIGLGFLLFLVPFFLPSERKKEPLVIPVNAALPVTSQPSISLETCTRD